MNVEEQIRFYVNIFKKALGETGYVDAAIMVTQEIGKDIRQSLIPDNKIVDTAVKFMTQPQLATPKQILALKKHNLYREGMTKEQATNVIKESIEKSKSEDYY